MRLGFFGRLFEQVAVLPGVRSAGAISLLPVTGTGSALHFNVQGRPPKSPEEYVTASYRVASAGYLQAVGVPLITGRWIEDRDREGMPAVVVVNSTFARTHFPNQSPIGQHIQLGATPESAVPWMEVVGIVGDVKQALASESPAEMYVPYRQADKVLPVFALSMVVRTSGDPLKMANSVRGIAHGIDANQPLTGIRTMEQNIAGSIAGQRFRTVLLAIFAGIALVLAGIGIFGVMAYSVAQRTREIGVRMALGASRGRVLRQILAHGVRLTLLGVAIGTAATFLVTRYVSSLLFNVPPYDPMTLVGVASGLVIISLCACYFPAHRATLVDPIMALRQD